jgi:cell division septal protein FtsQ
MSVRAPAEKNFRRARVKPGRRRGWRARIRWRHISRAAATFIAVYATYRAFDLVVTASPLQVSRIAVHGNVRLSSGEVQALTDGLRGTSILLVDLERYRTKLLESPWVAAVALRRVLPGTVEVFISERRPVGLCRLGDDLFLIDREGTVIDQFGPKYLEFDLPIIDGLVRAPDGARPTIDPARAELAARVIDALAPRRDLARRVSQIEVRDVHDAVVLLDDDPALLHLGDERFLERLQAYLDLASALRARVPDIDYVDLRFDERVYVRPAGGRNGSARRGTPTAAATTPSRRERARRSGGRRF